MQAEDRKRIEFKKQEQYKYEDLFKNKKSNSEVSKEQTSLIQYTKMNLFQKILNKIKQLFIK